MPDMPDMPDVATAPGRESESETPFFAWLESPNDDGTRVYLSVIRMPRPTRELLLAQGIPAARLDPALHTLAAQGLVSLRPGGVIDVPPPLTALAQHAFLLERRASAARAAADSLSRIYNASRIADDDPRGTLEVLTDLEHVGAATNEAVAMAAMTRNFSTMLNGLQVDEPQFRRDLTRLVDGAKAAAKKARTTAAR